MLKMFVGSICIFVLIIHFTASSSYQEDLSISNYSHIACLTLDSDKQHLLNSIQTNSFLTYQSFLSSNMSIELCFRLCRRWMILINQNHTNCICLYTINKPYQFQEYLGEISLKNNCQSNDLYIYSLTKDFYLLPALSSADDWSLDGCYYLHGIQNYRANLFLIDVNHTQAIHQCRLHCQTQSSTNYVAFFLSLKKSCYCLPIATSKTVIHKAVRKPLIHCSFLSYVSNRFNHVLNQSEIHPDTVVKIDVQRFCLSPFTFDKDLYLCLTLSLLNVQNSYWKITPDQTCLPILIKTHEQWIHLKSFEFPSNTRTFIWIDRNSTYLFDNLFKFESNLSTSKDLCIVVNRMYSNALTSFNLTLCSTARSPGYVLCTEKPLETVISEKAEFQLSSDAEQYVFSDNFTCPSDFIQFNNMCYFVDTSFVYDQRSGDDFCSKKYFNSTLVQLNSHEWGNVNATRFRGRTDDDILLEFFYYQLERKIKIQSQDQTNKKHWLRLLVVDKNPENECILRYFVRSAGAFTSLSKCNDGGHPVCQSKPVQKNISTIIPIEETTASSLLIKNTTDTTTERTLPIISTTTNLSIVVNDTSTPSQELISDEDLVNNNTDIDYQSENTTEILTTNHRNKYPPFFMIITAPLLAVVLFIVGIIFFVGYFRRSRGSYSTRHTTTGPSRRPKRSASDRSSVPSVLYNRLKTPSSSITIDADMLHPFDNSLPIDDNVQLLPSSTDQIPLNETIVPEDDDESFYAILKTPYEK